ncbi:hypothetical protein GJAV_G00069010 [Gymnothorax javanicus]|nr:hypothetical protein GJAV_G00069010 [Gymnothorax javanicus]
MDPVDETFFSFDEELLELENTLLCLQGNWRRATAEGYSAQPSTLPRILASALPSASIPTLPNTLDPEESLHLEPGLDGALLSKPGSSLQLLEPDPVPRQLRQERSMASLSDLLKEVRSRAESCLMTSGSSPELKPIVQEMANIPLPLSAKYHLIEVDELLRENCTGQGRKESLTSIMKALNILEKYGCNLANPVRPQYWRFVKHNNPIFRATVDVIKGSRTVLHLYGYTIQNPDSLCFPDDVVAPDIQKVVAVTVEVMALHAELGFFLRETHQHPEFLDRILTGPYEHEAASVLDEPDLATVDPPSKDESQVEKKARPPKPSVPPKPTVSPDATLASPKPAAGHTGDVCSSCGGSPSLSCAPCGSLLYCDKCDEIFHRHPARANHTREKIQGLKPDSCNICGSGSAQLAHCPDCDQWLCLPCDDLYHSHPQRKGHRRTRSGLGTPVRSLSSDNILRSRSLSDQPNLVTAAPAGREESLQPVSITEWQCRTCTMINSGTSVLCSICDRPRLADFPVELPEKSPSRVSETSPSPGKQWTCQQCTYINSAPSTVCEVCDHPCFGTTHLATKPRPPSPPIYPVIPPMQDLDLMGQKAMREEGLRLVQHIREGEKKGVSPEEVYAALCASGGSNVSPCDWLESELPHRLDEICAMAASLQQDYKTQNSGTRLELQNPADQSRHVLLSRAEAKQAWLSAGGNTEKAVQHLLRSRRAQVRELGRLGFTDEAACAEALRLSGGDVQGALSILQLPLLDGFHQRVWSEQPPAAMDLQHPDKEWLCRRLLALYDLSSWGRCELVLALMQEPDVEYTLEDVVQVVRASADRDFIRRTLNNECPTCAGVFPKSKMQPLTSCECSLCCECFTQHFTVAVRDRHIRDMVCPLCSEPDINNPVALDTYFTLLATQLQEYLQAEDYNLFHQKVTEHALMKDPNFRWCTHCSFGFIYDGHALEITCPDCKKKFCSQCKKPWEPQHTGLTCEQFQTWKRENDPEYQKQGLAGYLRDNGITCPNCKFQYALSKGGCMHFTCSQCRYQFCSGCNNPYHTTGCNSEQCNLTGLHAHHPRDCLFYLRDWEPNRLQALLQRENMAFNTEPPNGAVAGECGVLEQKEEVHRLFDAPCGREAQAGQAGLCENHYREYLVSLINNHSLDPATLFDGNELLTACRRYHVDVTRGEAEEDDPYHARLLEKLMSDVPLGENSRKFLLYEKRKITVAMAPGKIRSTRRLRSWMVDQVNSGRYPGLVWDDAAKTMFRIPWKHAGKQDFRSDEDAAIFKAWAEFKGKLSEETRSDPASWKTRLRCALNKSPEFCEVNERSQLDISEPYKVYRLVPLSEQGLSGSKEKDCTRTGRRKRRSNSESDSEEENLSKKIKDEVITHPDLMAPQQIEVEREMTIDPENGTEAILQKNDGSAVDVSNIQLSIMIETAPPAGALPTLLVSVQYLGHEVLRKEIFQRDIRISYYPSSATPPPLPGLMVERVALPEPRDALPEGSITGDQLQACSTLLSFMEKGILLSSNTLGVLAQRFCQGRVFYKGPHAGETGPHKLNRTPDPVCLFNRQSFQKELDVFRSNGGTPPQCGLTMCFGQEFDSEDMSTKLITVHISLPWATQQVQEAQAFRDSVVFLQNLASQSPLSEVTLNLVGIS